MILLKLKQKNKHRLCTFIVDSGHCYNEESCLVSIGLSFRFQYKYLGP